MNEPFLNKLKEIVEANLTNENFGPEELARKVGMSHSSLHRKLKDSTEKTISKFIREIRLEKAKELLLSEQLSVSEIAYQVGFSSPTYFNKCFHEYFKVTPGEFKRKDEKARQNRWTKNKTHKILIYTAIPLIVVLVFLGFLNSKNNVFVKDKGVEKSIAVLPVKYNGSPGFDYQAEGCMEEILDRLMKIEDLRVISRTSVEQYRETSRSLKEIGKELQVSTLLESTFQKTGDKIILYLRLFDAANEALIWSDSFEEEWRNAPTIQSEAAKMVAQELHANITSREKQLLEKIVETSVEARDFYQQGMNYFLSYQLDNTRKDELDKAADFFHKALEVDSAHAPSYAGLATVFWEKNYNLNYFETNFLDSAFYLAQRALNYDSQLEEAYLIKGKYYHEMSEDKNALKYIQKAVIINPNYWEAYSILAYIYTWRQPDYIKAIQNEQRAISLNHGNGLANLHKQLAFTYACAGMMGKAQNHFINSFELSGARDSSTYYRSLGTLEQYAGNYPAAEIHLDRALDCDSNDVALLRRVGGNYNLLRNYMKSLHYYQRWVKLKDSLEILDLGEAHRIALAYYKTGQLEKAEEYFRMQENYCLQSIEKNRDFAQSRRAYYDLAAVYAFQEKKEEAYQLLDEFIKNEIFPFWWVTLTKDDPLFEKIRHEERFKNILADMEKKYLTEHNRVKEWMEENDTL
ncbi:MAG TPA: helix-turn-helix domain-containing protein [Tangfeifania sp.]|nr:helix-turn-helix domain-containing protein [Tangfeifania sp.]